LAVGDTNFQSKCLEEFNKYRDQGKTVVLVTHDIGTMQRYCDRAMLLRNGKIEMIGDPEGVGNKYVYQNMSDEEKRIFDEEKRKRAKAEKNLENMKGKELKEEKRRIEEKKRKKEEERKNKVAEITKVEFLDRDGKMKNVFQTGDDISIRVYFKYNKGSESLDFGLAMFSQENEYIIGINTEVDQVDTTKYIKKGFFQVNYKNISCRNNSFYIKASISGKRSKAVYDFLDRSNYFKIFSRDKNEGIVKVDYFWD